MKASHIQRPTISSQKLLAALVAFSGSAALFAPSAHAQATWTGTLDQDWNNAGNWSTSPSNPSGNFTLNLATGNFPVLGTASAFTPSDVLLGSGASQSGRFDHTAGSLSQANVSAGSTNGFHVGRDGGTGTYNLADTSGTGGTLTGFAQGSGSLTVGKLWVGGVFGGSAGTGTVNINTSGTINANSTSVYSNHGGVSIIVGTSGGSGTLNLDAGTVNAAGIVDVGSSFSGAQATQGTLNISGGVLNSEGDFRTAFAGSAGAQATVNLTGGTLNVASATKRWMILGRFDAANSTVNVNGGNLNLNTNTDIRFAQGGTGTHVINLNSGAITSYGGNQTGLGAGVVDLMQGNVAANNTFNLNGGELTIRQVISNQNSGTRTFNFNGGTLRATGNATGAGNASFFHLGTGNARANVRNGGAVIDSNGFNVTVVQALVHSNIDGDNATDGGLTKLGAGTLTLSAANTYTGATTISAGTLALAATGSIANSSSIIVNGTFDVSAVSGFSVGASQTIQGSGTVTGATTVDGTLAAGNSPGVLTFSSDLSLGATSVSEFEINGLARGTQYDGVDVGGALSYGGTMSLFFDAPISAGTYDLFGGFSGQSGTFASVSVGGSFAEAFSAPASITGGGWTASSASWSYAFDNASGDLTVSAIPEPSTFAALAGLAGLGAFGVRRRRRTAA